MQKDEEQAGGQQEEQQSDEASPHGRAQALPQLATLRRQQVAQGQHVSQGPTHRGAARLRHNIKHTTATTL